MPERSEANITGRAAEAAPPGLLWDREVAGFGLRVLPSGARTWLFKYRAPDGRQRWRRVGALPSMTADEARKAARRLRAAVDHGRDPSGERESQRQAAWLARAAAVDVLADAYAKIGCGPTYGWSPDIPDQDVLARLLALNLERTSALASRPN